MENEQNFYWWFERKLAYSKIKHSYYAWKNLNAAYNALKSFRAELSITDMNHQLLEDFELFLLQKGNSTNTVAEKMFRIKSVVKSIIAVRKMPYEHNPFLTFKIDTQRTVTERISIEDIHKIEQVDLSSFPCEAEARDMYIFSFYCAGIRFGDLCRLKKEMITDGYLCYTMHKSIKNKAPKRRRIKLQPIALRIAFAREGEFIFNTKVNWTNTDKSISSRNALYNKWLKRVCKKAEVIPLSYHTSRNSFSDYAKKKKIGIHSLKDMLGHSTVKSTEIYMLDFYQEDSDLSFAQMFG